jgi:hypothetical protein
MTSVGPIVPEFNGEGSNLSFALSSGFQIVPHDPEGSLGNDLRVYKWLDKNGNFIGYQVIDIEHFQPRNRVRVDAIDDLTFTLTGVSAPAGAATPLSPTDDTLNYDYLTSQLNGDVNVVIKQGVADSDVEVGSGGTASVVTGAATTLFVWHPKNVIWNNLGPASGNRLFFEQFEGTLTRAPGELVLNLLTGIGTNPWGGTLQVNNVDTIAVGSIGTGGEYIICNNDGDTINPSFFQFAAVGNALIVGGTGNDNLTGSSIGFNTSVPVTNIIVAGPGTDTLTGGNNQFGGTVTNIFAYNSGIDTITNFRAGNGSGDLIDLSAIAGINNFGDVQARMSQSGTNTVIDFGGGHKITLQGVTDTNLTAGNFLFAPVAAFVLTQDGSVHGGHTVQLSVAVSGAVSVNTSGGLPTLTLSNGAIATYDAAASSASGHILVFDYTIGATDLPTNLSVAAVNPNGATIRDANGHDVSFSLLLNNPTGLVVNPATVTSVTPSQSGEVDSGQLQLTVTFSQALTLDTTNGRPTLTLSDGATAFFDHATDSQIVFDYTLGANDHSPNLQVTSFNLSHSVITDAHGLAPDFFGALNVNTGAQIGPSLYVADFENSLGFAGGEVDSGTTLQLFLAMNKAVTLANGSPSLMLSDGATATYDSTASNLANGLLVFDYMVGAGDHLPDLKITAVNNGASVKDANNNSANFAAALNTSTGVQIGASPLFVNSVMASPAGQAIDNTQITITINLNEAFTVTGVPTLMFNDDEEAFYNSGASNPGAGTAVFTYTVDTRDYNAGNLEITGLIGNGATIRDANGYNADLSHATNMPLGIGVGTTLTPLVIHSITTDAATSEVVAGQTLKITLSMTEGNLTLNTSGASPKLTLDNGAIATYDGSASNLTNGTLVFDYTVGANDHDEVPWIRSASLIGATLKDQGNNNADLSNAAFALLGVQIGAAAVDSVSTGLIGNYQTGDTVQLALNLTNGVTVNTAGGSPTVTLNDGATATYDAGASNLPLGVLVFDYTIGAGQTSSNLEITGVHPNNAVILDPGGNVPDFSAALDAPTYLQINMMTSPPPPPGPNPPPPGDTTALMIMSNPSNGTYEVYDVGGNAILAAYQLGQVGTPWTFAALGTFQSGDSSDMLLRNGSTGAFETYYVSGNNITNAALVGTVGLDWNFAGIGDFDDASSLSELMLRNASSGSFELYRVAGGGVLSGSSVAPVGNNFQVKGFGNFSGLPETQMIMQDNTNDASAGQLELYTYQPSAASLAGVNVGKVGSNLSIVGCADLLGNGMTQMVMQQDNGNFWLYSYDAGSNSLSGTLVGAIGSNFHVVGLGPLGTAGRDEMLMQDAAGNFEVYQYNASLNAFVGNAIGTVGAPWVVDGIAADPPTASTGSSDSSTAQLVQAMAGFGGGSAGESVNTAPLGADTSQQSLLTTPQHA